MKIAAHNYSNETDTGATLPGADDFCSTKQAASIIGVSHRTIQLWVESGILQAWKTAGGHRRITMQSVSRLVDQRREALAPSAAVPVAQQSTPSTRKKVLVVDDDTTLLRLYELEMMGWDVPIDIIKAQNGFEALIRIGADKPDLLISDLSMPGMDGFRMIRTLRLDPAHAAMAIVVVSGLDKATVGSMGLPADIPFFSKPVPFRDLREAVVRVLLPVQAGAVEH
ncbi:response regulator [Herbaspirillum sp. SJZ107]|uniref:response regulator n=1 Tax=Herbaspirillum sp. SJZ107 TaxID=2572881 RepID=UPI00114E4244|nr:response regulator [Herbaspirillum sp. SJZ107]TQK11879.1 excisionase family DNA binding protein [Herbaspirillum sp. SJZ107]